MGNALVLLLCDRTWLLSVQLLRCWDGPRLSILEDLLRLAPNFGAPHVWFCSQQDDVGLNVLQLKNLSPSPFFPFSHPFPGRAPHR